MEPQINSLCLITSVATSIDCKDSMFKQKPTDDLPKTARELLILLGEGVIKRVLI